MANKLYIGNLPFSTDDAALKAHFEQAGPVTEAVVIKDKMTGRSRGFGFVTFENEADAAKAIETLDGAELDGRALRVNEAQAREER